MPPRRPPRTGSVDRNDRPRPNRPDSEQIRRRLDRESVYLLPPTEIDLATVDELVRRLEAIGPNEDVTVDLRHVEFCSGRGLSVLLQAHQRALAMGSSLTLSCPPPHVELLLSVTGLDETFTIRRPASSRRRRWGGTDAGRR